MCRGGHFGRDGGKSKAGLVHGMMRVGRHGLRRPGEGKRKQHDKNKKQVPTRDHRFMASSMRRRRNKSPFYIFSGQLIQLRLSDLADRKVSLKLLLCQFRKLDDRVAAIGKIAVNVTLVLIAPVLSNAAVPLPRSTFVPFSATTQRIIVLFAANITP